MIEVGYTILMAACYGFFKAYYDYYVELMLTAWHLLVSEKDESPIKEKYRESYDNLDDKRHAVSFMLAVLVGTITCISLLLGICLNWKEAGILLLIFGTSYTITMNITYNKLKDKKISYLARNKIDMFVKWLTFGVIPVILLKFLVLSAFIYLYFILT